MTFWLGAAGWAALGLLAIWGDRRRHARADLDRVGWVPWPLVLIVAMIGAALCVAMGIR